MCTSGRESQVMWCLPQKVARMSIFATSISFFLACWIVCAISAFTWRLTASMLAHVLGTPLEEYTHPCSSGELLSSQPELVFVFLIDAREDSDVRMAVYIMSRNSRGSSENCGILISLSLRERSARLLYCFEVGICQPELNLGTSGSLESKLSNIQDCSSNFFLCRLASRCDVRRFSSASRLSFWTRFRNADSTSYIRQRVCSSIRHGSKELLHFRGKCFGDR